MKVVEVKKYNLKFDVIRVLAMGGIIVDHYLQSTENPFGIGSGLWMGNVFLMCFFSLSALIFGVKWVNGGYNKFDSSTFLFRRCIRIYLPLWLSLPLVITIEYIVRNTLEFKTILFNVLGIGWFRPFVVAGHLWYITLILFLYLVFLVFSHLKLNKLTLVYWGICYILLGVIYIFWGGDFSTFSSVAPIVVVFFASILFYKWEDILRLLHHRTIFLIVGTLLTLLLSWYMYVSGWHDTHKAIATFSSFSAGFTLFICLLVILSEDGIPKRVVNYFASISYEVYLVHLPLLALINYVFKQLGLSNVFLLVVVWFSLTWFFSLYIHKITHHIADKF